MKKYLFFSAFFLLSLQPHEVFAQSEGYWMNKAGGTAVDEGVDIAIDQAGRTYTTGYFTGLCNFGSFNLQSSGVCDIFIAKSDTNGRFLWVIKAGGFGVDKPTSVKYDPAGFLYVCGFFTGSALFGSTQLNAVGFQDAFVAKYDTSGMLIWAKSGGGEANDQANGVAFDPLGNVVITGQFIDTATFSQLTIISQYSPLSGSSSVDAFTAKYNASGNLLWIKKGSSTYTDKGIDIGCDNSGNIFITGQFSDTITFDQAHNNNLYNSIFLLKYDSNGNEQWFSKIGGGLVNKVSGLAVDNQSNIFLTGDFTGFTIFFGNPNFVLTNTYPNRIFIAKYDSTGSLLWAEADGSSGTISAKNICVDDSSNSYIIGNFCCKLNEYADEYGQGVFKSVGFNDIFTCKYDANGNRQWMRQLGGQYEDNGSGIALNNDHKPVITGSYINNMMFTYSNKFCNPIGQYGRYPGLYPPFVAVPNFCNDPFYNYYNILSGFSGPDIFNGKPFDLARSTYDYQTRNDSICIKNDIGFCIHGSPACAYCDHLCSSDTVIICKAPYNQICAVTNTAGAIGADYYFPYSAGPLFNFLWSNGKTVRSFQPSTTGWYTVNISSIDGCFTGNPSIYAIVTNVPTPPVLTLNPPSNTVCKNDSLVITASNIPVKGHIYWNVYPPPYFTDTDNVIVIHSTDYPTGTNIEVAAWVTDSNGCGSNYGKKNIYIDSVLTPIDPKFSFWGYTLTFANDTVKICKGNFIDVYVYDSLIIPNPGWCRVLDVTSATLTISPNVSALAYCSTAKRYIINQSGWYTFTCTIHRTSPCGGSDNYFITKTVYIKVKATPNVNPVITGPSIQCPGDSVVLTATGGNNFYWYWIGPQGSIISDIHAQSVLVNGPATYHVVIYDTLSNGCTDFGDVGFVVKAAGIPNITMVPSNGVICPNDSVQLHTNTPGIYHWYGPLGPVSGNTSTIYVSTPGNYYCIVDSGPCNLLSTVVEVTQYGTPFIAASPSTFLCPGESIQLNVQTNAGSTLLWQPPLSGSNPVKTVNSPGVYVCTVNSCGIITQASVTIVASLINSYITPPGPVLYCDTNSVLLTPSPGAISYLWLPVQSYDPFLITNQPGVYTLIETDAFGCIDTSAPVTVTSVASPVVQATISGITQLCPGDTTVLTASGGTYYHWSGPGIISNPDTASVFLTQAGNYTVIVSDTNSAGCFGGDTANVAVVMTNSPTLLMIPSDGLLCPGDSVLLEVSVQGTYHWYGPGGLISNTDSILYADVAGDYYCIVDTGVCSLSSDTVHLTAYTIPVITSVPDTILCPGETIQLQITVNAGSVITWQPPLTGSSLIQTISTGGIYSCSVLCCNITTILSSNIAESVINSFITPSGAVSICDTNAVNLTASPGATSYYWLPSGQTDSIISVNQPGVVFLVETDGLGCKDTSSPVVITSYASPPDPVVTSNAPLCAGDTLFLSATTISNVQYHWSGPDLFTSTLINPSIAPAVTTSSGIYALFVSDGLCSSDTVLLNVMVDTIQPIPQIHNTKICLDSMVIISVTPVNNGNYVWTLPDLTSTSGPSVHIPVFHYADAGVYQVNVTSGECSVKLSRQMDLEICGFQIPNIFTPNNDGKNDYFLVHDPLGSPIHCSIYNRWGDLIYENENTEIKWDGSVKGSGSKAPDGIYFYILYAKSVSEKPYKGTVLIQR